MLPELRRVPVSAAGADVVVAPAGAAEAGAAAASCPGTPCEGPPLPAQPLGRSPEPEAAARGTSMSSMGSWQSAAAGTPGGCDACRWRSRPARPDERAFACAGLPLGPAGSSSETVMRPPPVWDSPARPEPQPNPAAAGPALPGPRASRRSPPEAAPPGPALAAAWPPSVPTWPPPGPRPGPPTPVPGPRPGPSALAVARRSAARRAVPLAQRAACAKPPLRERPSPRSIGTCPGPRPTTGRPLASGSARSGYGRRMARPARPRIRSSCVGRTNTEPV